MVSPGSDRSESPGLGRGQWSHEARYPILVRPGAPDSGTHFSDAHTPDSEGNTNKIGNLRCVRLVEVFVRHRKWLRILVLLFTVGVSAACSTSSPSASVVTARSSSTTASEAGTRLAPGVLSRAAILARFPPIRPGITVEAKLVTLASLAQADSDLTQCESRGCAPGQLVWLVLEQGPPGSFPHSETAVGPAGGTETPGADAWALFPVNAETGIGRGDSEIGAEGQLADSAWGKLSDLAG